MSVIEGLRESFRLPDLRRRILITIALLIIYRFAANVPVPGVDREVLRQVLSPQSNIGAFAQVLDLLSGGAVSNFSVLAMGVYPYITASIILQILTPIIPALEELQKEGKAGRDKLNRITYYASIPLAMFQAVGQINIFGAGTAQQIIPGFGFGAGSNILLTLSVISIMTAGTMFAIWIGELISEDGIGNGISLIIFAGIVARVPFSLPQLFSAQVGATVRNVLLFVVMTVLTLIVIVIVQEGQRRIPVKYGKRVRGTKMYGGGSTYLPLRVNTAGMIPLIFAQSILTFPAVIAAFFQRSGSTWVANAATTISNVFGSQGGALLGGQILYWTFYFLMVVGFTYLYTDIMIKNQNLAENLQRNGGFIPGIRPGRRTEEFINRVVTRITLVGALFLGFVAVLPGIVQIVMNLIQPGSGLEVRNALYIISGGGLIIVVGVVLDTLRQLEAQLVMRHRETFIR
ncbi:MAG TPA: preprotein translocase subunit SecY [Aggregatilineales bacterium]|nr:preprotein translocase subunit SecY [Aggregatilineales bacterium]HPV06317.1 preprotein translocase subunit SecY [Aggregatilineales bacterium]HQA67193.1 preprotein translocase subunit SecY [Aggregatilineales bacterium]HQE17841.1 preprotein translocase subunit SecY [Aggregatilineales bacterium]